MRVRFRIVLYREGKKLRRSDFVNEKEPLYKGMRYITEFKYLEATKWLLIAPDCHEKYLLLGLINLALGQKEQAREFLENIKGTSRCTDVEVFVENPERGMKRKVDDLPDLVELSLV